MATIQHEEAEALHRAFVPVIDEYLSAAARSRGDFHSVEVAGAAAILKMRELVMTSGLRVSAQCAERDFRCPQCCVPLRTWERRARKVETSEGAALHEAVRYRCPKCQAFYSPLEEANGLANSQFTTMAQGLIARTATQEPYARTAATLAERGIDVSPKEVDRMTRDVAVWRRDEEQAAVTATFDQTAPREQTPEKVIPPLFDWSGWQRGGAVQMSVDGGRVRSPERGPDGLEWFEARAAIIAPVAENRRAQKVYLGGVVSPDDLFDRLAAAWRQGPGKDCPIVFVADGAPWIWDRVRLHFSGCIEVLDIYHAGEHLASAALALWGEGSDQHREWRSSARDKLLAKGGVHRVLRALLAGLRSGEAKDERALRVEIAYLWRHRHRMRYHWLQQGGWPVGSGAMESAIKQVMTARLRGPGMKWTREGADAVITLRAAHHSGELDRTNRKQHRARMAVLNQYLPGRQTSQV